MDIHPTFGVQGIFHHVDFWTLRRLRLRGVDSTPPRNGGWIMHGSDAEKNNMHTNQKKKWSSEVPFLKINNKQLGWGCFLSGIFQGVCWFYGGLQHRRDGGEVYPLLRKTNTKHGWRWIVKLIFASSTHLKLSRVGTGWHFIFQPTIFQGRTCLFQGGFNFFDTPCSHRGLSFFLKHFKKEMMGVIACSKFLKCSWDLFGNCFLFFVDLMFCACSGKD